MTFFQGHEIYVLDAKGRVNIPSNMRKSLSPEAKDSFTLTRGFRKCISAYPLDEWEKIKYELGSKNQFDEENDYVISVMLMWCRDVTLDGQQRIVLPKKLLDFAGIEKQVLILGKIDHIEFWNPDEFENIYSSNKEPYEAVAARVMRKAPAE
jgi:MraZ protein